MDDFDVDAVDIAPVLERIPRGTVCLRDLSAVAYDVAKAVQELDRFDGCYGDTVDAHKQVVCRVLDVLTENLPYPLGAVLAPSEFLCRRIADATVDGFRDAHERGCGTLFDAQNGLPFLYAPAYARPFSSPRTGRTYALKFQGHDSRDIKVSLTTAAIPPSFDLREPRFPPVLDQGSAGTCAAHAGATALRYCVWQERREDFSPSPLFINYMTRSHVEHARPVDDAGVTLRDVCKAIGRYRAADETLAPYSDASADIARPPSALAVADANARASVAYRHVAHNLLSIKNALARGFPVMAAIRVHESFESDAVMTSGDVPLPASDEKMYGCHAILLIGYDDADGRFSFQLSWGTSVGDGGFFRIPYAYIASADLAGDFWVLKEFR